MSPHKNYFRHWSTPDICNLESPITGKHQIIICNLERPFTGQHQVYAILNVRTLVNTKYMLSSPVEHTHTPIFFAQEWSGKGLKLGEKINSEQRDESLRKTPDTSHSTAASSLEDRRTLPLLGTGTPVTKEAPLIKKTRRRRRRRTSVGFCYRPLRRSVTRRSPK